MSLWMTLLPSLALAVPLPEVGGVDGSNGNTGRDVPEVPADALPEDEAIVNGLPATIDDFPMAGALLFEARITPGEIFPGVGGGPPQHMRSMACSSTLIAPDVVLLAAHCVDETILSQNGSIEDLEFRWSRQTDFSDLQGPNDEWPEDAVVAWDWATPPDWDASNMESLEVGDAKHDIALLFLDTAQSTPYALLPTAEEGDQVESGAIVDIVGWGMQDPIGFLDSLSPPREGSVGIKYQAETVIADVGTYEFQVGAEETDGRKCKGDSGGPTFLQIDTDSEANVRLVGVTSRSADYSLCESKGGYDTRVVEYLGWIEEAMAERCEDGGRAWCETPGIVTPEWYEANVLNEGRGLACDTRGGASGGALVAVAAVMLGLRRRKS